MQNTNAYVYICIVLYIYIYIHVELAESSTSCIYRRDIYRLIVSEEKVVCGVHFFFLVVGKSLKACLVALQSINHSINWSIVAVHSFKFACIVMKLSIVVFGNFVISLFRNMFHIFIWIIKWNTVWIELQSRTTDKFSPKAFRAMSQHKTKVFFQNQNKKEIKRKLKKSQKKEVNIEKNISKMINNYANAN